MSKLNDEQADAEEKVARILDDISAPGRMSGLRVGRFNNAIFDIANSSRLVQKMLANSIHGGDAAGKWIAGKDVARMKDELEFLQASLNVAATVLQMED